MVPLFCGFSDIIMSGQAHICSWTPMTSSSVLSSTPTPTHNLFHPTLSPTPSYTAFPLHPILSSHSILPSHPTPFYPAISLPCHPPTLPSHSILPCHFPTLSSHSILPCYPLTLPSPYPAILLPCHLIPPLPCHSTPPIMSFLSYRILQHKVLGIASNSTTALAT